MQLRNLEACFLVQERWQDLRAEFFQTRRELENLNRLFFHHCHRLLCEDDFPPTLLSAPTQSSRLSTGVRDTLALHRQPEQGPVHRQLRATPVARPRPQLAKTAAKATFTRLPNTGAATLATTVAAVFEEGSPCLRQSRALQERHDNVRICRRHERVQSP